MKDYDGTLALILMVVSLMGFGVVAGLVIGESRCPPAPKPCVDTYQANRAEVECDPRAQIEVGEDADGKTIVVCRCEREKRP